MTRARPASTPRRTRVHRAWIVAGVAFVATGGAAGQLVFLPLLAALVAAHGWRAAALTVAGCALAVVPLVALFLRDYPAEVGLRPYGATAGDEAPAVPATGAAGRAVRALRDAARTRAFWFLAGGFAICGASTNGLIGTHFIPAAHDHGLPTTTAAGLLALVGVFDIVGTVASGLLTDRYDPRALLGGYYLLRGLSLLVLPGLFAATVRPSMLIFVIFYGLDWVSTVPPTIALCRQRFGADGAVVFGWVFASHQLGAAAAAVGAGVLRDGLGSYTLPFSVAGALCLLAALLSLWVPRAAGVVPRRWRVTA
jgi:predicted MFS family arabinose efflux permease